MTKKIRVFQIAYNEETLASVDPCFVPLNNLANERPDWSEYWPVRKVLMNEHFAEDEYIGFFSPRFTQKTMMTGADVLAAIETFDAEVFSFSPYFDISALFLNAVLQGEHYHPGLLDAMRDFVAELGVPLRVDTLVADHQTTIFCNYVVAKPALWKKWLVWGERLFEVCERGEGELAQKMAALTNYTRGDHPMKVFVMERMMSLLLEVEGLKAKHCVDLRRAPLAGRNVERVYPIVVGLDALKGQYRSTGQIMFLRCYDALRQHVLKEMGAIRAA